MNIKEKIIEELNRLNESQILNEVSTDALAKNNTINYDEIPEMLWDEDTNTLGGTTGTRLEDIDLDSDRWVDIFNASEKGNAEKAGKYLLTYIYCKDFKKDESKPKDGYLVYTGPDFDKQVDKKRFLLIFKREIASGNFDMSQLTISNNKMEATLFSEDDANDFIDILEDSDKIDGTFQSYPAPNDMVIERGSPLGSGQIIKAVFNARFQEKDRLTGVVDPEAIALADKLLKFFRETTLKLGINKNILFKLAAELYKNNKTLGTPLEVTESVLRSVYQFAHDGIIEGEKTVKKITLPSGVILYRPELYKLGTIGDIEKEFILRFKNIWLGKEVFKSDNAGVNFLEQSELGRKILATHLFFKRTSGEDFYRDRIKLNHKLDELTGEDKLTLDNIKDFVPREISVIKAMLKELEQGDGTVGSDETTGSLKLFFSRDNDESTEVKIKLEGKVDECKLVASSAKGKILKLIPGEKLKFMITESDGTGKFDVDVLSHLISAVDERNPEVLEDGKFKKELDIEITKFIHNDDIGTLIDYKVIGAGGDTGDTEDPDDGDDDTGDGGDGGDGGSGGSGDSGFDETDSGASIEL